MVTSVNSVVLDVKPFCVSGPCSAEKGPKNNDFCRKVASYVGKKNELFSVADFLTKPHGSTWPIHFDTGLCPHWFAALLRLDRSSRSSPLRQSLSASLTQAAGLRRAPGIEVNTSLGSSLGAVGICG